MSIIHYSEMYIYDISWMLYTLSHKVEFLLLKSVIFFYIFFKNFINTFLSDKGSSLGFFARFIWCAFICLKLNFACKAQVCYLFNMRFLLLSLIYNKARHLSRAWGVKKWTKGNVFQIRRRVNTLALIKYLQSEYKLIIYCKKPF